MTHQQALSELGLTGHPTADQIKDAYRRSARVTHPDNKATGSDVAFKATRQAFDILSGKTPAAVAGQAAQQKTAAAPKAVKVPKYGDPTKSREDWLQMAAMHVAAHANLAGIASPSVRMSVGYGLGGRRNKNGWDKIANTADRVPQVFIAPELHTAGSVLPVVLEAIKALQPKKMRDAMDAIWQIAGSEIESQLGPYPHSAAKTGSKGVPVQGTRLLKAVCPGCGYTIRVAAKWANQGMPTCKACKKNFVLVK